MAQLRYKKGRVLAVLAAAVVLYFLLRLRTSSLRVEYEVPHTKPTVVWEFVADFSNMKKLNPTILDFTIESESGNYDHWEYSTHYTERLSQLPFVQHATRASFVVRPEGAEFVIRSHHRTCFFFASIGCVNSHSEFRFRASGPGGTWCSEEVSYECPAILGGFCSREASFQRHAIRDNLRKHFASAAGR